MGTCSDSAAKRRWQVNQQHEHDGKRELTGGKDHTFQLAVDRTADVARSLLHALVTTASPRDRELEAQRARIRAAARFGGA